MVKNGGMLPLEIIKNIIMCLLRLITFDTIIKISCKRPPINVSIKISFTLDQSPLEYYTELNHTLHNKYNIWVV